CGAEVVARAVIQEHDFVPGFHAETEPALVKLDAAAGIKNSVGIAIHDIVDLVVDHAGRNWTADAEIDEAAFQQTEDAHGARALDLETEQAMQQPQIGTYGAGYYAGGNGLDLAALKVIGHFAFQNDML